MGFKNISVRKRGTIINVRVFDCINGNKKFFEGEARANNPEEFVNLMTALEDKGLVDLKWLENREKWW